MFYFKYFIYFLWGMGWGSVSMMHSVKAMSFDCWTLSQGYELGSFLRPKVVLTRVSLLKLRCLFLAEHILSVFILHVFILHFHLSNSSCLKKQQDSTNIKQPTSGRTLKSVSFFGLSLFILYC